MKELLFVTGNQNKVDDAARYLTRYALRKGWVEVPEIQSTDVTEVVKAKLQSAFLQTQKPCFVMDASLVIEGLCDMTLPHKNFPGALIKDVFKSMWAENITTLVRLNHNSKCLRKSVLWYHDGTQEYYFEESLAWSIADTPRGSSGYDRDTIFIPEGETRTFAEMSSEEKQSFALTGSLYEQFRTFLER